MIRALRNMKSIGVLCVAVMVLPAMVCADVGSDSVVAERIVALEKKFKDLSAQNKDMLSQINSLEAENKQLQTRMVSASETYNGQIASVVSSLEKVGVATEVECALESAAGIEIGVGVTTVTQGILGGDSDSKKKGYSTYSADFEFSKSFGDYGAAFVCVEVGDGDGIPVSLISGTNGDAGSSSNALELSEWWYEHYLLDGDLALTFGKLDATGFIDDNELVGCEVSQFMHGAFGNAATLAAPDNAMGVRLGYAVTDWCEVNVGAVDGNGDYNDVFADLFSFAQVNIMPNLFERPGNYRFYGWHSNNAHEALKDTGRQAKKNFGCGISFDQEIMDDIGIFARLGWADPEVNQLEIAWHGGVQIGGSYWNRDDDYVGLAVGQTHAGAQYEKAGNGNNHAEGQCEVYYNFSLHDNLQITPHVQLVWRPNGVGDETVGGSSDSVITIAGIRSQLTF